MRRTTIRLALPLLLAAVHGAAPSVVRAQSIPRVHLLYPGPDGSVFDRNCSRTLSGSPPVEAAWVTEAVRRAPEFQALWDKEGPAYLSATLAEVKVPFPFSEMQAALTVCRIASMSLPLMINVWSYLDSAPRRLRLDHLPLVIYHELMHTYVRPVNESSALRKKYGQETAVVLNHLHVLALEKWVLVKLGKTDLLAEEDRIMRDPSPQNAAYRRAWEIVNDVESPAAFVEELQAMPAAKAP